MIGAVILVVWIIVAVSQLLLRRRTPGQPVVRMWGFPYLTWLALAGTAVIFVLMAREPDTRVQLYYTGALTAVLAAVGRLRQRRRADG